MLGGQIPICLDAFCESNRKRRMLKSWSRPPASGRSSFIERVIRASLAPPFSVPDLASTSMSVELMALSKNNPVMRFAFCGDTQLDLDGCDVVSRSARCHSTLACMIARQSTCRGRRIAFQLR